MLLIISFLLSCGFKNIETEKEIRIDNGSNVYLIGDSRTYCGYLQTQDDRVNYLARSGSTYEYFHDNYLPFLKRHPLRNRTIVILYGINDIMQDGLEVAAQNWLDFYINEAPLLMDNGATIVFCSVNHVDYKLCHAITGDIPKSSIDQLNKNIDIFNSFISENLPEGIIYKQIKNYTDTPYEDGLHYSFANGYYIYEDIINEFCPDEGKSVSKGKKSH